MQKKKKWSNVLSINQYLSKNYSTRNDLWNWSSKKEKQQHQTKRAGICPLLLFNRFNIKQYCILH